MAPQEKMRKKNRMGKKKLNIIDSRERKRSVSKGKIGLDEKKKKKKKTGHERNLTYVKN